MVPPVPKWNSEWVILPAGAGRRNKNVHNVIGRGKAASAGRSFERRGRTNETATAETSSREDIMPKPVDQC